MFLLPLPPPAAPPAPPPPTALTLLDDAIARADGIAAETVVLNATAEWTTAAGAATNGGSFAAAVPCAQLLQGIR